MPIVDFGKGYKVNQIIYDIVVDSDSPIRRLKSTGEPVWIDRDRIVWPISTIASWHLQSIERWLLGRGAEDIPARKFAYESGWYKIVRDEMDRRGLECLEPHPESSYEKLNNSQAQLEYVRQRMTRLCHEKMDLMEENLDMIARSLGYEHEFDEANIYSYDELDRFPQHEANDTEAYW